MERERGGQREWVGKEKGCENRKKMESENKSKVKNEELRNGLSRSFSVRGI